MYCKETVWVSKVVISFTTASVSAASTLIRSNDSLGAGTSDTRRIRNEALFWAQFVRNGSSGVLFAAKDRSSDGTGVLRSLDNGATWVERPSPIGFARGIAYDAVTDILCLAGQTVRAASDPNVLRLRNTSMVTPASAIWESLPDPTGNIQENQPIVLIYD